MTDDEIKSFYEEAIKKIDLKKMLADIIRNDEYYWEFPHIPEQTSIVKFEKIDNTIHNEKKL